MSKRKDEISLISLVRDSFRLIFFSCSVVSLAEIIFLDTHYSKVKIACCIYLCFK